MIPGTHHSTRGYGKDTVPTYYEDDRTTVYHGGCIEVMRTLPDSSVDSIVTDPPYGLGFMGKAWDALPPGIEWARECLRVLKPGGHLLSFGGTRTWHRLAVAVEDAGFEIRDSIAWMYGSGFPKSHDVSKGIDKANGVDAITAPATAATKQWQGWGTALKPAFEPVVVARKPFKGTVAANVQTWGVGAINVDGCRIGMSDTDRSIVDSRSGAGFGTGQTVGAHQGRTEGKFTSAPGGRWPANVVLDEHAAEELDRQSGVTKDGVAVHRNADPTQNESALYGAYRKTTTDIGYRGGDGASRFFYMAKAPKRERPVVGGVAHATVKPLTLMRWLVRLVTPAGGTVLEPFAGSGTTVEACILEGFHCIAIEREAKYLPLIRARMDRQGKK